MKLSPSASGRLYLAGRLAPILVLSACMLSACIPRSGPASPSPARTLVDASEAACVVANAALTNDEIAKTCRIVEMLSPALRELVRAARVQRIDNASAPKAPACSSGPVDAGVANNADAWDAAALW